MGKERRRFKQNVPFKNRLSEFAADLREEAMDCPPGPNKEELLKRVRGAETAVLWDDWLRSPGQMPPIL